MWGSDLRANWAMLALAIALTLPFIVLPLWLIDWGSGVRGFLLGVSLTALFLGGDCRAAR